MKIQSMRVLVITTIVLMMTVFLGCKGKQSQNDKLPETMTYEEGKQNQNKKLLESVTFYYGNSIRLEYDNKNHITKAIINDEYGETTTLTLTYSNDKIVSIVAEPNDNGNWHFSIKGDEILAESPHKSEEMKVNNAGYIINKKIIFYSDGDSDSSVWESSYQYEGGNLISQDYTFGNYDNYDEVFGYRVTFEYDDKNTPINCNTPKWFIQYLLSTDFACKNNRISEKYFDPYTDDSANDMDCYYDYEYDSEGFPIVQFTSRGSKDAEATQTSFTYRGE